MSIQLFTIAAAAGLLSPAPHLELELVGSASILPAQGVGFTLVLENPTALPIQGVPALDGDCGHRLRWLVTHGGEERPVAEAHRPPTSRCSGPYRTLRPNEVATASWHLAVDWKTESVLFDRPGTYAIRAVLEMEDGTAVESGSVTVQVGELTEGRTVALDALRDVDGWLAIHDPDSIRARRDAKGLLESLEAWRAEYPGAPWGAEVPLLRAVEADHASIVASLLGDSAQVRSQAQSSLAWLDLHAGEPWAGLSWRAAELRAELGERLESRP